MLTTLILLNPLRKVKLFLHGSACFLKRHRVRWIHRWLAFANLLRQFPLELDLEVWHMDIKNSPYPEGRTAFSIPVLGEKPINAVLLAGKRPGKTLVVTAGVHGNEYVGIQAVRELIREIQPLELSGRLLLVPLVNESGFYQGTHLIPADGKNLNRCFPGSTRGSTDRKSTRLNSSHRSLSRMPSSA